MRELTISRRSLLLLLLLVVLVATSTIALPTLLQSGSVLANQSATTPTISPTPKNTVQANQADTMAAQNAAVAGAQAFYMVNYADGQKTWLDRLCAVSTQLGCLVDQTLLGPALWPVFLQSKTATTVSVTIQNKVKDEVASTRGNAPMQVWQLSIHLSAIWPQQKPPQTNFTALALIIQENNAWKFERFLTDDELQVIK